MNVIQTTNKQFTRASEVKIPEIYSRRFKTGKEDLDAIFGAEGFLPGQTMTVASAPGVGKTSFLVQILELLELQGKKTAYISGEECIEQLAYASKRLQVHHVPLANMTDIDEICKEIVKHKFDFVVLDSMPALTTSKKMNSKQKEEYIAAKIVQVAKEHEIVIATILHFTKTGTYKGGTLLPHSVDTNIIMQRNKEDAGLRDVDVTKNRFGFSGCVSFTMTDRGFDFEAVETEASAEHNKAKKGSKKETVYNALLENKKTIAQIHSDTNISVGYLINLLRELVTENKILKEGRGPEAKYLARIGV